MQPVHRLLLCRQISLRLRQLRRQPAGVQAREQLALLDVIALLRKDRRNALAPVERQLDLTQVHIAVKHELGRAAVAGERPPRRRANDDSRRVEQRTAKSLACDHLLTGQLR